MYVEPNFPTKKAVKDAIAAGKAVRVIATSHYETVPENGRVTLCGPHYPQAHKWYGQGEIRNGRLVSIK